jgi:Ca2+-binding EF-hand superfamily protein
MGAAVVGAVSAVGRGRRAELLRAVEASRRHAQEQHVQYERLRVHEASVAQERQRQSEAVMQQYREWVGEYDLDSSGYLDRHELRRFLQETEHQPGGSDVTDEVCEALVAMCSGARTGARASSSGVPVSEMLTAVLRYREYLEQRRELDLLFSALDVNGNGSIEKEELLRVMSDLAPPSHAVSEADLASVYAACCSEFGAPMLLGPNLLLLKPALTEWTRGVVEADAAAQRAAAREQRQKQQQQQKHASRACVVM